MSKNSCVIYAPVDTLSGYGSRSRDTVKSIIELKKEEWDIKIIPCAWGNTPTGFIDENPEWRFLVPYLLMAPLNYQPDIFIWITIPTEFQKVGKYNIGITAGLETDIVPGDWVEGCQRMNLVLGSSKHTVDILRNSKFEKRDNNTQQVVGMIEWTGEGMFHTIPRAWHASSIGRPGSSSLLLRSCPNRSWPQVFWGSQSREQQ